MVKLCKDCKYYREMFPNSCTSPDNGHSVVTGEIEFYPAEINRRQEAKCGQTAKWFVQQTPKEKFYATFRYVPEYL